MRFNAFFKVAAVHPARHGQCASDRLCGDGNDAASPLDGLCESWQLAEVDLFLREGSGLDVLRSIQRRLPHQRVAVLTNYPFSEMRERTMGLGAAVLFRQIHRAGAVL
jgi:DNA-binding NarL/FixJ family response regulator